MKTILTICGEDFYLSDIFTNRMHDGLDIKCNSIELLGILHNNKEHFLKLWGNSYLVFKNNDMDYHSDGMYHRLIITGVDEI